MAKRKRKVTRGQTKTIKGKSYKLGKTSRWERVHVQTARSSRRAGSALAGIGAGTWGAVGVANIATRGRLAGALAPVALAGFVVGIAGLAKRGASIGVVRRQERALMITRKKPSLARYRKEMKLAGFKTYHERTTTPRKTRKEHKKIRKARRKMGYKQRQMRGRY